MLGQFLHQFQIANQVHVGSAFKVTFCARRKGGSHKAYIL